MAEKEVGVEDILSLLGEIQEAQSSLIRKLLVDFAEGFNLSEEDAIRQIFPKQIEKLTESTSAVKPKYVNPDNPEQTWAGRGKIPLWMEPWLDKGYKKEEFLISNIENFKKD